MPEEERYMLIEKNLGSGDEVMVPQGEDIHAILKLSPQQSFPSGEILDKTRVRVEFKKDFIISSKLTNR